MSSRGVLFVAILALSACSGLKAADHDAITGTNEDAGTSEHDVPGADGVPS